MFFSIGTVATAQQPSTDTLKVKWYGDMRVRFEEDWNGVRSNGIKQEDRTRMRLRARLGTELHKGPLEVGLRLRTGTGFKQQDPNITLGSGDAEGGPMPVNLDRAYLQFKHGRFKAWGGKHSYPFFKQDELYWIDHVSPEGLFVSQLFGNLNEGSGMRLGISAGHFFIRSANTSLDADASLTAGELHLTSRRENAVLDVAASFLAFNNIAVLPDQPDTTLYDHPIVQGQLRYTLNKWKGITFGYEGSMNLDPPSDIPISALNDQGMGHVLHLEYGKLKRKGDFKIGYSYAYIEKFSTIDYLAQNDWARWDYSSVGSQDGSLTNMNGHRVTLSWMALDGFDITLIGYFVERIEKEGNALQRGDRARLDFTWKF